MEVLEKTEQATGLEKITKGLQVFEDRKATLQALADSSKELAIVDLNDKEGYIKVRAKAIEIRKAEIEVENEAKELRALVTPITKMISAKEKELLEITEVDKNRMVERREWFENETARIKAEKEAQEKAAIQARIDALAKVGVVVDFVEILGMSEEHYQLKLKAATDDWEAEQKRIADEAARLEAEKKAEAERLEQQRKEQEAERVRLEKIAQELEETQAKVDAERKVIEDEKNRIEREKQAKIEAEQREKELAEAREKAAAKALADAEAQRIREEEEKAAAEKLAAEKEAKRIARMPDKKKLQEFANRISGIVSPELKTPEAEDVLNNAIKKLSEVQAYIMSATEKL